MNNYIRAKFNLNTQADAIKFVQMMCKAEHRFLIEDRNAEQRVDAKSMLGVIYAMSCFGGELYLVNETKSGAFPAGINDFRD